MWTPHIVLNLLHLVYEGLCKIVRILQEYILPVETIQLERTIAYREKQPSISMRRVTLEKVIAFLKMDLLFACCWPVSRDATKFQLVCDKIFRLASGLHAILLIIELIYTILYRIDNVRMLMQSSCAVGILFEVPLQILLFTLQHDRLQVREIGNY